MKKWLVTRVAPSALGACVLLVLAVTLGPWIQVGRLEHRLADELALESRDRTGDIERLTRSLALASQSSPVMIRVLSDDPKDDGNPNEVYAARVERLLEQGSVPAALPSKLEGMRAALAPGIAAIRSALQSSSAGLGDPDECWKPKGSWPHAPSSVTRGFVLEAMRALDEGRPELAAAFALDLWRLESRLVKNGKAPDYAAWSPPSALLRATLPRLNPHALRALASDLGELDAGWPSFAESARRRRLQFGCALRAFYQGTLVMDPEFYGAPRAATVALWWTNVNALLDAEEATSRLPSQEVFRELQRSDPCALVRESSVLHDLGPRIGAYARCWADSSPGDEFLDHNGAVVAIRCVRLLALVQHFLLEHRRPPATLDEALGSAPGIRELDPFSGRPLRLLVQPSGSIAVYSVWSDGIDDGGKFEGGQGKGLDVGFALPR